MKTVFEYCVDAFGIEINTNLYEKSQTLHTFGSIEKMITFTI